MSVLQRKELEDSPLADLHAIASELGLEGFRAKRREELVSAILTAQGGGEEGEEEVEPAPVATPDEPEPEPAADEPEPADGDEPDSSAEDADEAPPAGEAEPEESASGILDILPNGSGFVRLDPGGHSRGDIYVSPAQIRRCELRAGDEVGGPVRPPRRNERHPSLVRVESVNGGEAEPPEQRPHFSELTPVHPSERLTVPPELDSVPIGKGARVAVGGPPGAGATSLLRRTAATLAEKHADLQLQVVLVGVRPEEVTDWRRELEGVPVRGGGFDRSIEAQTQEAELAVERAKRVVERGKDAVLVIDSLEALPPGPARRLFGAARKAEEGGSLTILASTGMALEPQRHAGTRVMLDTPEGGELQVSAERSGALRADLLG